MFTQSYRQAGAPRSKVLGAQLSNSYMTEIITLNYYCDNLYPQCCPLFPLVLVPCNKDSLFILPLYSIYKFLETFSNSVKVRYPQHTFTVDGFINISVANFLLCFPIVRDTQTNKFTRIIIIQNYGNKITSAALSKYH